MVRFGAITRRFVRLAWDLHPGSNLLMETGDNILLENGTDAILLEQ